MSVSRKLASIQYVHDVTPIEGADRIECVHVLGWQCVAPKGQFKVGDLCVYMEVDSFLPICDEFEFLRASSYKKNDVVGEGFRLKTQKFRGQISQGLVQPLSILPDGKYNIGDDVTNLLGIKKWEVEETVTGNGTIIGEFPSFINKTDELRIQSYPELIREMKEAGQYYITTKMDGSSVTMYLKDGHFGVCSRNKEFADDDKCPMWKFAHQYRIYSLLLEHGFKDIAIQGEFCGPGIQKNRLKLIRPQWYVFTIVDLVSGERFDFTDVVDICDLLGLEMVPIEEVRDSFKYDTVDELIERAKGKYVTGNNKEGIVIRPTHTTYSSTISGPLSFKVLNNDYLLKE